MKQLLAHLAGDYLTQSHWEATTKTQQLLPAVTHALKYTACFVPLTRSPVRLAIIGGTHFAIDHWRLAKRMGWAKNQIAPSTARYEYNPDNNGYPEDTPPWLSTWLMIITDNTVHMGINYLALRGEE